MLKKLAFGLFDSGETILGALVFSTFFPLYITQYIDTKVYSTLYGLSFAVSFVLALLLGKKADREAKRKTYFIYFSAGVSLFCGLLYFTHGMPIISLFIFMLLALFHQQAFVFYNSLLLEFNERGITSGLGVALGYVASAVSLLFLIEILEPPEGYIPIGGLFLLLSLPAFILIKNPLQTYPVSLKEVFKDRRFLLTIVAILSLTEVANTLIAMMGIYLREVYGLENAEIYKIIGLSALGGVTGGILWGKLADKVKDIKRLFGVGFLLWIIFLLLLPLTPPFLLVGIGFWAGISLAHLWTCSRLLILKEFPEGQASVRLSFLSLSERIASTTGLLIWSLFLFITGDNYRLSVLLMTVFPLSGFIIFQKISKNSSPS